MCLPAGGDCFRVHHRLLSMVGKKKARLFRTGCSQWLLTKKKRDKARAYPRQNAHCRFCPEETPTPQRFLPPYCLRGTVHHNIKRGCTSTTLPAIHSTPVRVSQEAPPSCHTGVRRLHVRVRTRHCCTDTKRSTPNDVRGPTRTPKTVCLHRCLGTHPLRRVGGSRKIPTGTPSALPSSDPARVDYHTQ